MVPACNPLEELLFFVGDVDHENRASLPVLGVLFPCHNARDSICSECILSSPSFPCVSTGGRGITRCMTSPTNRSIGSRGRKTLKKSSSRPPGKCRTKRAPPLIYVRTSCFESLQAFARAHLRNKRGYLYLTWRDGAKVRTFYLGKAPRV